MKPFIRFYFLLDFKMTFHSIPILKGHFNTAAIHTHTYILNTAAVNHKRLGRRYIASRHPLYATNELLTYASRMALVIQL